MVDALHLIQPALGIVLSVLAGYCTSLALVSASPLVRPYTFVSHMSFLAAFVWYWPGP